MTVKEFFSRALNIQKEIDAIEEQISKLRDMQIRVTANLGGEKVQSSPSKSRTADLSDTILDLENEYIAQVTRLLRIKYDIVEIIEKLDSSKLRLVLFERYINGKQWEDIAWDNSYSLKGIHNIHVKALAAAEQFIPIVGAGPRSATKSSTILD